jgi:hypothetical protein
MISMARTLAAPETVPAGKGRLEHVERVQAWPQFGFDVRDDVHHVRIALDDHVFGELDRTDASDAADVVATEVEELHMLRTFLLVGQ